MLNDERKEGCVKTKYLDLGSNGISLFQSDNIGSANMSE